jgi:hypothetical protein
MSTGRSRRRRCRPSDYPLQRRCRRRGGDMETRLPTISSTLLPICRRGIAWIIFVSNLGSRSPRI